MREQLDRFLEALRTLRPADRQVIVWRIELGYTAEEIADETRQVQGGRRNDRHQGDDAARAKQLHLESRPDRLVRC